MELANHIQAILFYQAEPLAVSRLAKLLKRSEGEVRDAAKILEESLATTGLRLLQNGDNLTLGTAPEASALIEAITKEELAKELSKASLETLAIVLYKAPIARAEIDYIRGVNSTFILRNLLIRGLVEKVENPADQRSFLYKPTFQLLEFMGVAKIEDLPNHADTMATLSAFVNAKEEKEEVEVSTHEENKTSAQEEGEEELPLGFNDEALTEAEIEADILDEDQAGENFDDEELRTHHEHTDTHNTTEHTA